jgi:type I restriction enzyme M protein
LGSFTIAILGFACGGVLGYPDNALFEGGETVRRRLLGEYYIHTLLRLPTGIFYAQGVKANVLFFERKPAALDNTPWTRTLRIYDLRTNTYFRLKAAPISTSDLEDFVSCYNTEDRQGREETERFRAFGYEELVSRDKANLDISWLRDKSLEGSEDLQPPDVIAAEIAENLEAALEQFSDIHEDLRLPATE